MRPDGTVVGRVNYIDRNTLNLVPIPNALVSFLQDRRVVGQAVTDTRGMFAVKGLTPWAVYSVIAASRDYVCMFSTVIRSYDHDGDHWHREQAVPKRAGLHPGWVNEIHFVALQQDGLPAPDADAPADGEAPAAEGGEDQNGEEADGEEADGEEADGEEADGEEADGEEADGEEADGEEADGEEADGEKEDAEEPPPNRGDGDTVDYLDYEFHEFQLIPIDDFMMALREGLFGIVVECPTGPCPAGAGGGGAGGGAGGGDGGIVGPALIGAAIGAGVGAAIGASETDDDQCASPFRPGCGPWHPPPSPPCGQRVK
jgi:hypothetical protein